LSVAFAVYPDVFDPIYTGMLRTGEASGRMAETLESLAAHLEENAELRHRVRAAMMYPIGVAALAVLLTTGIMTWIVPAFESIYADMGQALPAATQFLISVSTIVRERTVWVFLLAVAMVALLRICARSRLGRRLIDRSILAMPVVGPLAQKVAIVRFAQSLSQMLRNGVPILNALQLVGPAIGNSLFEDAIDKASGDLTQGQMLSVSMARSPCFTPMVIQMITAGERTGQLDSFLARTAEFYRKEVAVSVQGLTALIEPLLIVFLGVVVGGMVVCMFIPIFRLHELTH
jgi:type IV pilus assembly protein PilC